MTILIVISSKMGYVASCRRQPQPQVQAIVDLRKKRTRPARAAEAPKATTGQLRVLGFRSWCAARSREPCQFAIWLRHQFLYKGRSSRSHPAGVQGEYEGGRNSSTSCDTRYFMYHAGLSSLVACCSLVLPRGRRVVWARRAMAEGSEEDRNRADLAPAICPVTKTA